MPIDYSTAADCVDELPGHIGPYEVRDRLGQGGMGVVYLAFDPLLDRPVAIKVLKVPDEETRRRFLREARLAARVHHPHIVSIYAVGEHEGNPYLAMEFIAGRTMAQIIRNGDPVPLARKVHWLSELCAGLGHAHQSGIVHRDVKPSNLLIAQSTGTLRLLDFGIAHGNEASSMTMAGMIVGTPQYMSPEQIQGHAVDARSDIFSVGAVAYELLTGRQAFGGDNLYHVSRQIVNEQPRPLESFVPDTPTALVRTIARCLQKEPAARPESATELEREFLAIARRLDPDHTLVVRPAEPTVVAAAKDLTTSRREMLREAEAAIEQGELTVAAGLLQKLESGAPSGEVLQLRQKLQGRRVELRVQDALTRADEAVQTGTVQEAEDALTALAEVAPRHAELDRLRTALQTRIDARQVANLTSRARQALQEDRLDDAEALVAEALALAPDAADALAVQQKLLERTRAQRIARLVAQASRALDQDDAAAARRAIDTLVKIDPGHRDVARLQGRLQALAAEIADRSAGPETPARPAPAQVVPKPASAAGATKAAPVAAAAVAAGNAVTPPAARKPAPAPLPVPPAPARAKAVAHVAAAASPASPPVPASSRAAAAPARRAPGVVSGPADEALLRHEPTPAGHDADRTRPAARPSPPGQPGEQPRRTWVPAIVVAALLALGGGAYYALVVGPGPEPATPASGAKSPVQPTRTSSPLPKAPSPGAVAPAGGDDAAPTTEDTPEPPAATETPVTPVEPPPPPVPRADPWQTVRQLSARNAFDRAMGAIDQVKGVAATELQAERLRVVDGARRYALAARRGAEDLRLTTSPQYVLGATRQADGDRQRQAGRPRGAVGAYMQAHAHFVRAITESGRNESEKPPVKEPIAAEPPPAPARPEAKPDLSTWSNDEARSAIARFCGAYLARDLGGIGRLWPNLGPEWRNELREAFATEGELVCVFENVVIVRTSEEFNATARLLTQLPGGEQRRRSLVISLVPSGDRLVFGNIRVR